jgi:hypothetical protein
LPRTDFNRLAVGQDLPLFWANDEVHPGELDPDELVMLGVGFDRSRFVGADGKFTQRFEQVLAGLIERRRQEALATELAQGRPTLIHTDLRQASEQDKAIVAHITAAARIIEELHALQLGTFELRSCVQPGDLLAQAVFRRNQGPWCRAPATEADPFCNACSDFPPERSGLYPLDLQQPNFCEELGKRPDAAALLDPFCVVRHGADGQRLEAIGYQTAYAGRMRQVAAELRACAAAIRQGEEAFQAYLLAAASAFETNRWEAADEAWAAMNATNSKWYLRIGPDEVYFEPCSRKAGFHVSFARIDADSLYWQERLTPLRQEMEQHLADQIGPAYQARRVSVHLPDFIEVVLNAGDARHPLGATIGQSLPNWGAVAEQGRGRTVVMSNLYTDPDSLAVHHAQAAALLSPEALQAYTRDKRLRLLDIVLHEATHNFGPHSDYKVDGKRPAESFGGELASVLEELKAQTGALFFVDLLRQRGLLSQEDAQRVWLHSVVWCFGHIAQGMVDANGRAKPYSQVSAIQVGFLTQQGALEWQADQTAANGRDRGRFHVHFDRFAPAAALLMHQVGDLLARADPAAAKALIDPFIRGDQAALIHQAEVATRVLRQPKASFVYSVTF